LDCENAGICNLTCGEGTCIIKHPNVDTTVQVSCGLDQPIECSGQLGICNGTCP
jgi:hypothetical protein